MGRLRAFRRHSGNLGALGSPRSGDLTAKGLWVGRNPAAWQSARAIAKKPGVPVTLVVREPDNREVEELVGNAPTATVSCGTRGWLYLG